MYVSPLAKKVMAKFSERENTYDYTIKVNTHTGAIWEVESDVLAPSPYQFEGHTLECSVEDDLDKIMSDHPFWSYNVFPLDTTRFFSDSEMQLILTTFINRRSTILMQMLKIEGINGVHEALVVTDAAWKMYDFEDEQIKEQEKSSD